MQFDKSFLWLFTAFPLPLIAQTESTEDGTPSPRAEEIRWILNRGRFDPAAENTARGTAYVLAAKPPLAPNAKLIAAAQYHATDMAAQNVFSHSTITNSARYPWAAHQGNATPDLSERFTFEGYSPFGGMENLSGNPTFSTALSAYLDWWASTDHRSNMYDVAYSAREIGYGYAYNATSTRVHHHVMVGSRRSAATGFFTDTLFRDLNSDNAYNEGEGIAGIRIDLNNNGTDHTSYDLSGPVGSFAVPTHSIAVGNTVQVYLTNTAAAVSLSIPIDYHTLRTLTLARGEKWLWGSFIRAAETNAGFRNLTLAPAPPIISSVKIATATGSAVLSWPSETGTTYQVQWSPDLAAPWIDLSLPLTGTGSELTLTDPATTAGTPRRFYKVIVTTP